MYNNFGEFIKDKRLREHITVRELARRLGVSAPYVTDVEKDRRNPFNTESLEKLPGILNLTKEEARQMYDLAGQKRQQVAPDIPQYIMERDYVSFALRTARDLDAGEEEWMRFVDELRKRKE